MSDNSKKGSGHDTSAVTLEAAAERRLVRPGESARHIDLSITAPPATPGAERPPLSLALVVDRSGSMHGNKLTTAKAAALAVLTSVIHRLREYAKGDPDLEMALEELERQRQVCKEGKMTRAMSKELTQGYMSSSRGQRDQRGKHS